MNIFEKLRAGEYEAHPPLDEFEGLVLQALIASEDETRMARNNKTISDELSMNLGRQISRNAVARARRRIAHKVDIIKPGF